MITFLSFKFAFFLLFSYTALTIVNILSSDHFVVQSLLPNNFAQQSIGDRLLFKFRLILPVFINRFIW